MCLFILVSDFILSSCTYKLYLKKLKCKCKMFYLGVHWPFLIIQLYFVSLHDVILKKTVKFWGLLLKFQCGLLKLHVVPECTMNTSRPLKKLCISTSFCYVQIAWMQMFLSERPHSNSHGLLWYLFLCRCFQIVLLITFFFHKHASQLLWLCFTEHVFTWLDFSDLDATNEKTAVVPFDQAALQAVYLHAVFYINRWGLVGFDDS